QRRISLVPGRRRHLRQLHVRAAARRQAEPVSCTPQRKGSEAIRSPFSLLAPLPQPEGEPKFGPAGASSPDAGGVGWLPKLGPSLGASEPDGAGAGAGAVPKFGAAGSPLSGADAGGAPKFGCPVLKSGPPEGWVSIWAGGAWCSRSTS